MRARKAVEAIKQETNGRLDVQLFPNNQLGGDSEARAAYHPTPQLANSLCGPNSAGFPQICAIFQKG